MADDPALIEIRKKVEAKLPKELHEAYTAIVKAGMDILFSDSTHEDVRKILGAIQQRGNKPQEIANGMVRMLLMIAQSSNGNIDPEAMYPALMTLTSYVLDYAKSTMGMPVTPDFIKQVMTALAQAFAQSMQGDEASQSDTPEPAGVLTQPQGV